MTDPMKPGMSDPAAGGTTNPPATEPDTAAPVTTPPTEAPDAAGNEPVEAPSEQAGMGTPAGDAGTEEKPPTGTGSSTTGM